MENKKVAKATYRNALMELCFKAREISDYSISVYEDMALEATL